MIFSSIEVLNLTIAAALIPMAALARPGLCLRRDSGEYVVPFKTSSLGCHLYLVEAPAEAGFHGDGKARVALKGLWVNFTHLVVTMKPLLSAAALTWVSTLLKFSFSWLKRPKVQFHKIIL